MSVGGYFDKGDRAAFLLVTLFMSVVLIEPLLQNVAQSVCPKSDNYICEEMRHLLGRPSFTDWLLVLVGLGQLCVFAKQMRISRQQTDIQRRQAETLPRVERPYIFVEVRPSKDGIAKRVAADKDGNPFFDIDIEVNFVNQGKTPARIKVIRAYSDTLPDMPVALREFTGSNRVLPDGLYIRANGDYKIKVARKRLNASEWQGVVLANETMYCVGRIDYEDIFEERHSTGFCWQYVSHVDDTGEFAISADTPLNFLT